MHAHWIEQLATRGEQAVAYRGEQAISANELLHQAGAIAAQLPDASPGSEVAFSFERDHAACVAALLATWAKGHTAAVPEDGTRETIMPLLTHPRNVAFLHDTGVGLGVHVPTLLADCEHQQAPEWQARPTLQVALLAHAQPIIGAARVQAWTQTTLLAELERLMQDQPEHVASCLTPTAMASLLLGTLASLNSNGTFEALMVEPGSPNIPREHRLIAAPAQRRALKGGRFVEQPRLPLEQKPQALTVQLESALLALDEVQDAGAALLPGGDPCALVLVAAPAHMEPQLHEAIASCLPKQTSYKLRLSPALPRVTNGHLPDWRIYLAFHYGANGAPLDCELTWTETADSEPTRRRFRTQLPENYAFFEGHYRSYPVLAGAAQIHELAQACIKLVNPDLGGVRRLSAIKFTGRIQPQDELDVVVIPGAMPGGYRFEIMRADKGCSSGRIEYFTDTESETP
ncbi:MAG: hypothetical protein ACI8QC_001388 [Planctomycetota bacterium]|jgi:hypothetical protein